MKAKIDVVVTRHSALVTYLKEKGLIREDTRVLTHASPEDVQGKHVLGVLPHSLSALCESFTEITLQIPPELRGKELSVEDIHKYASGITTYVVRTEEAYWTEIDAAFKDGQNSSI